MTIKHLLFIFLGLVYFNESIAHKDVKEQYYYLILFKDKDLNYVNIHSPETFLSKASLERRKKFNIEIDSFDLPVTKAYVENIKGNAVDVLYQTKWMNGAVIRVEEPDSARILMFKWFVKKVILIGKSEEHWHDRPSGHSEPNLIGLGSKMDKETFGKSFKQIDMLKGLPIYEDGNKGKGIKIAVFDEGFYKVDQLSVFKHLRDHKLIKGTYDIVEGGNSVYEDGDHGMRVLSCMAAYKEQTMSGTAPNASYYLFRTENNKSEYLVEELNWIRAAEMADSMGIDIINSSLGYTTFDDKNMHHKWSDLDGETTYITRGATIAGTRGILVVNSAGNDGNKKWKYLDPPADAKNILTVGAVDLAGRIAEFSSSNYPENFFTKPDIVAPGKGVYIANSYGSVSTGNGTSYACPITAGLCACLMEQNPNSNPLEIIRAIQKSGARSYYPDNTYGYGLPSFELANTFLGGNSNFDYTKVQFVQKKKDYNQQVFLIDIYNKEFEELEFRITVPKRFLFIKYYKKLNKSVVDCEENFTQVQAFVPAKYLGKNIRLQASLKKEGNTTTIYKEVVVTKRLTTSE